MKAKRIFSIGFCGLVICWTVTTWGQVVPREYLRSQPLAKPEATIPKTPAIPLKLKTLYVHPGVECVVKIQPYLSPNEDNQVLGAIQAEPYGRGLRVVGIPDSARTLFGRDLGFTCPIRLPGGSIITQVNFKGDKEGGNPATDREEASSVLLEIFGYVTTSHTSLVVFDSLKIEESGPFDRTLTGRWVVEEGYPILINIAFNEPGRGGERPDFPVNWNFNMELITIVYQQP